MKRLAAAFALLLGTQVLAHPTPGSIAYIDLNVDGARVEQDVPIEELQRAIHQTLWSDGDSAESSVRRNHDRLKSYAATHLQIQSTSTGHAWPVEVVDVVGHASSDGPRAQYHFAVRAPAGESSESLLIHDDLIAHEVISHYTLMYVRTDWATGALNQQPRLIGTIHAGRNDVTLVREASIWRGLGGAVLLGVEHIATGTDHLMFLFALVLVAPAVAVGHRWRGRRDTRETLLALAKVVSAFTLGHSATLAFGVLGGFTLSSVFVEAAIAVSILVTAGHAFRPIFPGREALVAGLFGLVHGLAFASGLLAHDVGRVQAAWTLIGFNVGIELAQVSLLALAIPWLLLLARTTVYAPFRAAGAVLAGVLATGWLVERTVGIHSPLTPAVDWTAHHPLVLLVSLAVGSMAARMTRPINSL